MKFLRWFLGFMVLLAIAISLPEFFHTNEGKSQSIGSVRNGKLENSYLIPYVSTNFSYFSPLSYFIADNAYLHSSVFHTVMDAYKTCQSTAPGIDFRLMECSDKHGGKMLIHRTHQNGTSVDFMVPKKSIRTGKQSKKLDWLGFVHYLLDFDDEGRFLLYKDIIIDYESMGEHILAIDDAAAMHGLSIRKIIFKIELLDDFYATKSGKKVKARGIYFVKWVPDLVNRVHDDHYHIDFVFK